MTSAFDLSGCSAQRRSLGEVSGRQYGPARAAGVTVVAFVLLGAVACTTEPVPQHTAASETTESTAPHNQPPVSAAPAASPPLYSGPPLIDHTQWTSNSRGRTLRVYPTASGRTAAGDLARTSAWQEVLRTAPLADTASMRDQFYCHWDFARLVEPAKTSWNLEAWRPDVGYAATVQAECNPGGPE